MEKSTKTMESVKSQPWTARTAAAARTAWAQEGGEGIWGRGLLSRAYPRPETKASPFISGLGYARDKSFSPGWWLQPGLKVNLL